MSMSYDEILHDMYMEEQGCLEYEAQLIDDAIDALPVEKIRSYLGTYGDAIEDRIKRCLDQANKLLKEDYIEASLVISYTAIEMIIRYLIVRPLLEGTFLADQTSEMLLKAIIGRNPSRDLELLPKILNHWDISLTSIELSNGENLWGIFKNKIIRERNNFIHGAKPVEKDIATVSLECARRFLADVVGPMSIKFGFNWKETGKWNECSIDSKNGNKGKKVYVPQDFFKEEGNRAQK